MNRITPQFLITFLCNFRWYHKYCEWRRKRWVKKYKLYGCGSS